MDVAFWNGNEDRRSVTGVITMRRRLARSTIRPDDGSLRLFSFTKPHDEVGSPSQTPTWSMVSQKRARINTGTMAVWIAIDPCAGRASK